MTSWPDRLPRPATEHGRDTLGGLLLGAVLLAIAIAEHGFSGVGGTEIAAIVTSCTVLTWRRQVPVVVLAVVLAVFAVATVTDGSLSAAFVPLAVALYTAVVRASHVAVGLVMGALTTVAVGVVMVSGLDRVPSDPQAVSAQVWIGLITATGVAMHLYRRSVAQERERTRQAEETREALARGRVAEERMRIARELHDAVGHHVAVMNVQAGVAEALLAQDPARAAEALARVQDAGARVLEELPVMLRVLRQDEDDAHPTSGLATVGELVEQARDAGLAVQLTMPALAEDLPAATDHAAYRIVQEALTNARRYGTGVATLSIALDAEAVIIHVVNSVDDASAAEGGTGFGLLGMRERAAAAGGAVTAARDGAQFMVRATLPTRKGAPS